MKKVLITGASSGIGLKLCQDYLKENYEVIACGRNKDKLTQALHHDNVEFAVFDMTNREQTHEVLSQINIPDLVILNAGDCQYIDDAKNLDGSVVSKMMDINFMGTVNCLETILPQLNPGAHVAVMSSSVTYLPLTRSQAYGASKAALEYFTLSLAVDMHQHGISFSLIKPGFVETPLTQKNNFPMPGKVTSDLASQKIRQGIERRNTIIEFPWIFILLMRLFSLLPQRLWHLLAVKMVKIDG